MGRDYRVRVHIEIVPAGQDADTSGGKNGALDGVDEEAVKTITEEQAVSIDDMEETLLQNTYEVMRRALERHFSEASKRGLSTRPGKTD